MFKDAWQARIDQAKGASKDVKGKIAEIDKQIEQLVGRIMDASSMTAVGAYEEIAKLEKSKVFCKIH
ncbi:hypothetical protein NBRC116601_20110 [Cognatishimia sp. WU-CL00825]|uniref:hypothetical protein n=1 Tax=Cognatishimia sp. WU-CL00825 TaxID=3127658 RepID=UPI003108AD6B